VREGPGGRGKRKGDATDGKNDERSETLCCNNPTIYQ
jgi:hypothetical protein